MRIAPSTSRYFEVYVFDVEPVPPGAVFTLPVAVVEQDVETMSCRKGEVLSTFDFLPDRRRGAAAATVIAGAGGLTGRSERAH